jgi:hypothetical protein
MVLGAAPAAPQARHWSEIMARVRRAASTSAIGSAFQWRTA